LGHVGIQSAKNPRKIKTPTAILSISIIYAVAGHQKNFINRFIVRIFLPIFLVTNNNAG